MTITTKELRDVVAQAYNGLITDAELLLKLQLPPNVVPRVIAWSQLPLAAFDKIDLGDLFDNDDPRDAPISAAGSTFASVLDATLVKDWLCAVADCLSEYRGSVCDVFTMRIMHYEYSLSDKPRQFYAFDFGATEANTFFLGAMKSALSSAYTQDELLDVARTFDGYDADAQRFIGVMVSSHALYALNLHVPKPLVKTPLRTLTYDSVSAKTDEAVPKTGKPKPHVLVANLPNRLVSKQRNLAVKEKISVSKKINVKA